MELSKVIQLLADLEAIIREQQTQCAAHTDKRLLEIWANKLSHVRSVLENNELIID